jgi:hypothetical protein
MDLVSSFQALVGSGLPNPQFVQSNSIGDSYMNLKDYMYKELFAHAKYNKYI